MLTEEEKEILHKAGEILYRVCSSRRDCIGCPLNNDDICYSLCHSFDEIGKKLQKI